MSLSGWIHTELEQCPPGEPRHERLAEHMAGNRAWLASDGDDPTVAELTGPIVEAVEHPFDRLRDRAQAHLELVEYHEFNGLTVSEFNAARAHLALHHAIVDRLAACFRGLVPGFEHDPAPALRQALYMVLGTEDLAYALSNRDAFPSDD